MISLFSIPFMVAAKPDKEIKSRKKQKCIIFKKFKRSLLIKSQLPIILTEYIKNYIKFWISLINKILFLMGYGLWVMGYGLWVMGYGLWVMGYGLWVMGYVFRNHWRFPLRCPQLFPGVRPTF